MFGQQEREDGFTLIELMVVVLIIGILIAIALPTFLGARERAADRAVQMRLRTGLAAGLAFYAERQSWDNFDAAQAETEEPSLIWADAGAPGLGQIAIQEATGDELLLVSVSTSGSFYCLAQLAGSPATDRGSGTAFDQVDDTSECTSGW